MKQTFVFLFLSLSYAHSVLGVCRTDTLPDRQLQRVEVYEGKKRTQLRSSVPLQSLSAEELKSLPVLQVSDAAKFFSGVQVKDYGGVGGLKTVSVRSLGAQHTAVAYDGLLLTDGQTGQIDLGKFSMEQVQTITLANGQMDDLLQSARALASGALLSLETRLPEFSAQREYHVSSRLTTGSWGLFNPSCSFTASGPQQWVGGVSAEWTQTDGHYPFDLRYGAGDAITERKKRNNTDVRALRLEAFTAKRWNSGALWKWRAYFYQSERGLPGATTYYYDHAAQRLDDRNAFVQTQYQQDFGSRWSLKASAKWNGSRQEYLDPDYKGSEGQTRNDYRQQEYYVSAALRYRPITPLAFAFSTDGFAQTMEANLTDFARPRRYTWLSALSGKYTAGWVTLNASALFTRVFERTLSGASASDRSRLSPFASVVFTPFPKENLRLRFFVKDIFRMPTFNDLYYGTVGTRTLKPEKALQYNAGVTYEKAVARWLPQLAFTVDAYYNRVSDKIVAIPTKNLFIWSMVNLGKVDIRGVDVTAQGLFRLHQDWQFRLSGNYTYQRALDVTSDEPGTAESLTYGHQIPYTPRVYASGTAALSTPWGELSYALLYSGKRYALGQNIAANRLDPYTDHSLTYRYNRSWGKHSAALLVECLNLADKNYEIVKNFPMPGRSFRVTLTYQY